MVRRNPNKGSVKCHGSGTFPIVYSKTFLTKFKKERKKGLAYLEETIAF